MTQSRAMLLSSFLEGSGWGDADHRFLAGDASNRSYQRLTHAEHGNAVLMDAPPEKGEDVRPFIAIANHLRDAALSAPEIFASDIENGFLLIEDLGDDLFVRVVGHDPSQELALYDAATRALHAAQAAKAPAELARYGVDEMTETSLLAPDWYLKYASTSAQDIRAEFRERILTILQTNLVGPDVLVQRDYHAENLLWLPDRKGVSRVGLLDFQDAMLGHPAYDLASLLKDARRSVSPNVQTDCINTFLTLTKADPEQFAAAYAACSAQRNLRIIGVFARLSIRDGKRHYPDMLPRVWHNLMSDLEHPALQEFGRWVVSVMPEPSAQIINHLKSAHV